MIFSKCQSIDATCNEYVHPWSESCVGATLPLIIPCLKESFRIYSIAYSVALLLKGRVPTEKDLKNTFLGIIQSCIFLTSHGVGYSSACCLIRKVMGYYNFYTISFLPSFLSSIISILIERPSRRALLSLYVTNVASETVFRMAVARKLVKPIPFGEVFIFAVAVGNLLYFYKAHGLPKDPVYSFLRFLVGPYEEKGYIKPDHNDLFNDKKESKLRKYHFCKYIYRLSDWYQRKLLKLKSLTLHSSCPHYYSCLYYVLSGGVEKFIKGYILQLIIKVIINFKRIVKRPSLLIEIPLKRESVNLAIFVGIFTSVFRTVSCALRRFLDHDSNYSALPAGFLAGLSFYFYRDNTIALYFMWKTFQICYNLASEKGYVPELPWAPVFLHAFSTAILFHVAIVEPTNLRPSYWNFLQDMSGEWIAKMDRKCIDVFGLESSKSLDIVLARTKKR
ncbi:hypothetical protein O3M35_009182 [Rhynocoris fuscipes]|uniref:Transmembrane protein 135 N-terminal domain-containing protein n=1 Tax=Rhynocoris fuscipes TaxID=488301 RepID=A0AAW1D7Y1_9HEMI